MGFRGLYGLVKDYMGQANLISAGIMLSKADAVAEKFLVLGSASQYFCSMLQFPDQVR